MGQKYYTRSRHKECIVEMEELTDIYTVFCFCLLNMYKYAYRAGLKTKDCTSDLAKIKWYDDYAVRCHDFMGFFQRRKCRRMYYKVKRQVIKMIGE